jgi:pyridinium-3,5-bisthiocarboxylic acid mononucleotide nickel chelatase
MIAYFDCFSGISGDMILGAFLDLGFPLSELTASLASLKIQKYTLEALPEKRMNLKGTRLRINVKQPEKDKKTFKEIRTMIEGSKINKDVKKKSIDIFFCLAKAEAFIHRKRIDQVHFHEIGAADSIIDIVGSVFGIHYFNIKEIVSSPLPLGNGFIQCGHGTLPLPAPATLEILKNIPVYGIGKPVETVTPTGAAIIATLAQSFGSLPPITIEKVGYGAGKRKDNEVPNLLRVILGRKEKKVSREQVVVIETNIDNMNPEIYEYLMEVLLKKGALDVALTPVQMKKNRPGILLKVIARENDKTELIETIFNETTTLGVRVNTVDRYTLSRETNAVETPWGNVRVKIIEEPDGRIVTSPEFEDCKRIARAKNIPLKQILLTMSKIIKP